MPKKNLPEISWFDDPEDHNFPAAKSYLSLTRPEKETARLVAALRRAKPSLFKAKDIFRASGLSLLGVSNAHIENDKDKIRRGKKLSPILLVRDAARGNVIVADGYHRLCAVYSFDEDAVVPCRIV